MSSSYTWRAPVRLGFCRGQVESIVVAEGIRFRASTDAERVCDLSVVLPCLNEAQTLATCVTKAQRSMEQLGLEGEVVIADNGSTDGSQEMARQLGARVVDVPVKGYGSALIGGIAAARSEFVVMADADNSYDLSQLGPFVEALR